jgi:hypothetical protein
MSDVMVWIAADTDGTVTLRASEEPTFINGIWLGGTDTALLPSTFPVQPNPGECRCFRLVPVDPEEES